jgi:hypothetical protein
VSTADGRVVGMTPVIITGFVTDRWNLVIMSEGYTADLIGPDKQFTRDVRSFVTAMLATPPFDRLRRAINVFRVDVVSDEAGADNRCANPATTARTYFDAVQCSDGIARLLVVNNDTALAVASAQVPRFHMALVIVNITAFGGSGGPVAVFSLHPLANQIGLHEMGHTAFGLGDEYQALLGCEVAEGHDVHPPMEPAEPNVTLDSQAGKWRDLVGPTTSLPTTRNPDCTKCDTRPSPVPVGTIGAFEGAHYYHCGAYRPAYRCRMGERVEDPFCDVCQRAIERRLSPLLPANNDIAVVVLDAPAETDFFAGISGSNFTAAMNAVMRIPHPIGSIRFPRDSAEPMAPTVVLDLKKRLLAAFPTPAVALTTYFSRAGDTNAGTVAIRNARKDMLGAAFTTNLNAGAGSIAAKSFDVGQEVFDVAQAHGITQSAIVVVQLNFRAVAVAILVIDRQLATQYDTQIAHGDLLGAVRTAFERPHKLTTLEFDGESTSTVPESALNNIGTRFRQMFPMAGPIITFPDHFSRVGDVNAGTPAARDARLKAVRLQTTTAPGGGASAPGAGVYEVGPEAFQIAEAAGLVQFDVLVLINPIFVSDSDPGGAI